MGKMEILLGKILTIQCFRLAENDVCIRPEVNQSDKMTMASAANEVCIR